MSKDLGDIIANTLSARTISLQKLHKEANLFSSALFPRRFVKLGFWEAYNSVEESGLADVGEADDAGLEAHAHPRA